MITGAQGRPRFPINNVKRCREGLEPSQQRRSDRQHTHSHERLLRERCSAGTEAGRLPSETAGVQERSKSHNLKNRAHGVRELAFRNRQTSRGAHPNENGRKVNGCAGDTATSHPATGSPGPNAHAPDSQPLTQGHAEIRGEPVQTANPSELLHIRQL